MRRLGPRANVGEYHSSFVTGPERLPPQAPRIETTSSLLTTRRAISGLSLLTSASKLLSPADGLRYRQFETTMAFAEAYVLHNGITIVGPPPPPNSREAQFAKVVNERRPGAINFLEIGPSERRIVDLRMADVTVRALGQRVTTGDVDVGLRPYRDYSEDATRFGAQAAAALNGEREDVRDGLRAAVNDAWERGADRSFANHLMRGFMFASIAHVVGGSALYTGHRKAVQLLVDLATPDLHRQTTALRLYRAADAALTVRQPPPDPQSIDRAFRVGLIPWIVLMSRGFDVDADASAGLGPCRGGRRLGHLLYLLDRLRQAWGGLLTLGAKYDAAEVWRPWRNPTVGDIRANARREDAERLIARLAHRQPSSAGERLVQATRDIFGGQQSVSEPTALAGEAEGVVYPVQVLLNILSLILPGNIDRRRAYYPVLQSLAKTNSWPSPCRAAFGLFRIETIGVGSREVPKDQAEISGSDALSLADAQLRLRRLLAARDLLTV